MPIREARDELNEISIALWDIRDERLDPYNYSLTINRYIDSENWSAGNHFCATKEEADQLFDDLVFGLLLKENEDKERRVNNGVSIN